MTNMFKRFLFGGFTDPAFVTPQTQHQGQGNGSPQNSPQHQPLPRNPSNPNPSPSDNDRLKVNNPSAPTSTSSPSSFLSQYVPTPTSPPLAPVFGIPLDDILSRPEEAGNEIPAFVDHIFRYLQQRAIHAEGIFRISGDSVRIQTLKGDFDKGTYRQVLADWKDYHSVAGLLKMFLRELPEPVFPFKHYDSFLSSQMRPEPSQQLAGIWELLRQFPSSHKKLLSKLIEFLLEVVSHSEENKMTTSSLAIVFAPNLLRPKTSNTFQFINDARYINSIIRSILEQYELLKDALQEEGEADVNPPQPPRRRRQQTSPSPNESLPIDELPSSPETESNPLREASDTAEQEGKKKRTNSDSEVMKERKNTEAQVNDSKKTNPRTLKRCSGSTAELMLKLSGDGLGGTEIHSARETRNEPRWATVQPSSSFHNVSESTSASDLTGAFSARGGKLREEKTPSPDSLLAGARVRGELIGKKTSSLQLTPREEASNSIVSPRATSTDNSPSTSSSSTLSSTAETLSFPSPSPALPSPSSSPSPSFSSVSTSVNTTTTDSTTTKVLPSSVPETKPNMLLTSSSSSSPTYILDSPSIPTLTKGETSKEEELDEDFCREIVENPNEFISTRLEAYRSTNSSPESVKAMNLNQLIAEKTFLKSILYQFNSAFEKLKGKVAGKEDKEPLRSLYRRYRMLKKRIESLESGEGSFGSSSRDFRATSTVADLKEEFGEMVRRVEELEKQQPVNEELVQLERGKLQTMQRLISEWEARSG